MICLIVFILAIIAYRVINSTRCAAQNKTSNIEVIKNSVPVMKSPVEKLVYLSNTKGKFGTLEKGTKEWLAEKRYYEKVEDYLFQLFPDLEEWDFCPDSRYKGMFYLKHKKWDNTISYILKSGEKGKRTVYSSSLYLNEKKQDEKTKVFSLPENSWMATRFLTEIVPILESTGQTTVSLNEDELGFAEKLVDLINNSGKYLAELTNGNTEINVIAG